MPAKVKLTVSKGATMGDEYVFDSKELLLLGRHKDCHIVLPESTVSRYHCMLDIVPPAVTARDFGSLNGTYLNGELMGQRPAGMSVEEGRQQRYNEFALGDGAILGLAEDCEIKISVYLPKFCSDCLDELAENPLENLELQPGVAVCKNCRTAHEAETEAAQKLLEQEREAAAKAAQERLEAERRVAELAAKERAAQDSQAKEAAAKAREAEERRAILFEAVRQAEAERRRQEEQARAAKKAQAEAERVRRKERKCQTCGAAIAGNQLDVNFCDDCRHDHLRVLEHLLRKALEEESDAREIKGYTRIRSLGRGGMGEVWLVEEQATGRQMALKLMLPRVAANEKSRGLFLREAQLAQQLNNRNVVRQFKHGSEGDVFFMLLEFCEGGSLDERIKQAGGTLDVDTATHIILQVLDGLAYTHTAPISVKLKTGEVKSAKGVVHRDLKPANIFLADNKARPLVKVADFGLSKAFETAGLSGNTRTGEASGTPVFMPVQQIINYRYAEPNVDVWAAAASYYFMLTGTYPKDFGENERDIWMAALDNDPVPILERNGDIPPKLAKVIDCVLIEKPNLGVDSAAEFKKMIKDAI